MNNITVSPLMKTQTPWMKIKKHWRLYVILLIPFVHLIIFSYLPMYGIVIAFKQFNPVKGIAGSKWVGLKYFRQFFSTPNCWNIIKNTLAISVYTLLAGFPIPIILAIAVNQCRIHKYKKFVQMVTYAPHFISTVVLVGILLQVTDLRSGGINKLIEALGGHAVNIMGKPDWFYSIHVWSGIWQNAGYSSILYIAALAGVSPELHEAAMVDGASRLQRVWHIDLPALKPVIVLQLIIKLGQLLSVGYEKVYLLQNDLNLSRSEIISTYVYKVGLQQANYSFSTAISLLNTVVAFILVISANYTARKLTETSMW